MKRALFYAAVSMLLLTQSFSQQQDNPQESSPAVSENVRAQEFFEKKEDFTDELTVIQEDSAEEDSATEEDVDSTEEDEDEKDSKDKKKSKKKKKTKYTREKTVAKECRPSTKTTKTYEDKSGNYEKECRDTFKYGLQEEIINLIDELTKNEDTRFVDPIYDLFSETKDVTVRNKIIAYFTKLKDPCLGNYACTVINDPYDEKRSTVDACFLYVSEAKISECVPGLVDLVDKEEEEYFSGALKALGELGSKEEAVFISEYLDRDDLSASQRQSLMKVLGRIKAVETWDKLAEIAQNEDENSFVRMYAAEAIGAMEKPESEEILLKLFESDDPNLRCHVIKGIAYFKDKKADELLIQALRDGQYKVRLEAVSALEERNLKEAVPYLVYRCKDKTEEKPVKEKCWKVLAKMNDHDGNEYLVSVITDKKAGDGAKVKVASCLLEENHTGTKEIIELAKSTLKEDKYKSLRYALGKEIAKYDRGEFAEICQAYLDHDDVATQGTGLDMWAKGRYSSCKAKVTEIAKDAEEDENEQKEKPKTYQFGLKKKNANAKKAKKILERN